MLKTRSNELISKNLTTKLYNLKDHLFNFNEDIADRKWNFTN